MNEAVPTARVTYFRGPCPSLPQSFGGLPGLAELEGSSALVAIPLGLPE
jgi:hypothetical protein